MIAFALLTMAAVADTPAVTPQPPAIVIEGNRRVCRFLEPIGSILPKRVCKTADEWQQERDASQRLIDQRAREQTTYQQTLIRSR